MKRYRKVKLDTELIAEEEIVLSEDDELTVEEPDENSAINEDNVAEEVLDIDDMEGADDEIALDEMDEAGDGSEA